MALVGRQLQEKNVKIDAQEERTPEGNVTVTIRISGSGKHEINLKTFNSSADYTSKQIDLSVNNVAETKYDLKIADINKPYIVIITLDKNPELQKEIVGSYF